MCPTNVEKSSANGQIPWINPVGGLGDTLMLSGVLKLVYDIHPEVRYHCVRRTQYSHILRGHPIILQFGFAPADARIITTDYWSLEKLGPGNQRAFQILARLFGLTTPVKEQLYIPPSNEPEEDLAAYVPWGEKNVIIAPASDSPRKMMPDEIWEEVVRLLKVSGVSAFQVGRLEERHIKGTYSLLGLSSPRQLLSLVSKADGVITVDNFVMHIAHLAGVFAAAVWGPTDPEVYGYEGQGHIRAAKDQCDMKDKCLGPGLAQNYAQPCPKKEEHCLGTISAKKVLDMIKKHVYR